MNRLLKTWLIWILVLALPAQALASMIKLTCGPTHHAISAITETAHRHSHHGAEHHTAHAHHHDVVDNILEKSATPEPQNTSSEVKTSYCSACATCCVGAAVASAQLDWTPVTNSAFAPALTPISSFTGFIPPGLERPPRLIS